MVDEQALGLWVGESLTRLNGGESAPVLMPLHGDAGFRRYFRIESVPGLLVVVSPVDRPHNQDFVALASFLRDRGIRAPRVIDNDPERGFMLVEDLGDQLLLNALDADSAIGLYGEALITLLRLQQCPRPPDIEDYDGDWLTREMVLFQDWFVPRLLGYTLSARERELLKDVFGLLMETALEQPRVLVHRDFHSRNLIVRDGGELGVIDFQGALWGPLTYDLVSLLKDCYIRWAPDQVRRWALAYGDMLIEAEIGGAAVGAITQERFLRWFDFMGMQRHIKVLGIFSRLSLRDGKPGYLEDLPLVIRYTLEAADRHVELAAFGDWFRRRLLPLCETQPWYTDYRHAGDSC